MSRIFLFITSLLFCASLYLNHTQNLVIDRLKTDAKIMEAVITDPLVELSIDRSTGTAYVTVNYLIEVEFPRTCPPQLRL